MNLSPDIDLGRSLRQLFGNDPASALQIESDFARQTATAKAILQRLFAPETKQRREIAILADEVGLGKTYVALAVAVSILDAIRKGEVPEGLPANRPVILVLTPNNDALFNKWRREAKTFQRECARAGNVLDWLQVRWPVDGHTKSGNVYDLAVRMREASRNRPMLLIAKQGALGAALGDRDWWRRRALAIIFEKFNVPSGDRQSWCRQALGYGSKQYVPELLDLRSSYELWQGTEGLSPDLYRAFERALLDSARYERIEKALEAEDLNIFVRAIDNLTRDALVSDWPLLPLVVIDEVHGLKNEHVQARRHLEDLLAGQVCRLLGLSATPFQLRPVELLSVLKLRGVLAIEAERKLALDSGANELADAIAKSKHAGDTFRTKWLALRPADGVAIAELWDARSNLPEKGQRKAFQASRPARVAHALEAAQDLAIANKSLRNHLRPFVIRHLRSRGYREYFVGRNAAWPQTHGTSHFSWAPGMEVSGDEELSHYVMMRAVALAKDEKGLPSLGAELTGSYRHLVETAAVWKRLESARNPLLREYRSVLEQIIGRRTDKYDPDAKHRKVRATVQRALECFKNGQKILVFCVFTKTAEAVRDQIQQAIDLYLANERKKIFGDETAFENFRRRFFNRREPLFSLIQDQPLLGMLRPGGGVGIPSNIALPESALAVVAGILADCGEPPDSEKPDRRLLLAATEHVAVLHWMRTPAGKEWLVGRNGVLRNCPDLLELMSDESWLKAREPLSRSKRGGRAQRELDPEARTTSLDPLEADDFDQDLSGGGGNLQPKAAIESWVHRLKRDVIGEVAAPYFQLGVCRNPRKRLPLLALFHGDLMAELNLPSRVISGQVFRRVLMANEFLLRYLADVEKDDTERWADYLSSRYDKPLGGHLESLRDRVHAYFETLVRGQENDALMKGYRAAAENRNVVQLVKGGMDRDRYFLGFNTPYRPEILISTQVGAEGIDLHRECRHIIHHDLCWNPATIEQRTGRVDRIGSKVERERLSAMENNPPTLEIGVPYLAATYDERMFEELHRRAQLFEVTMGGDMRVEGRIDPEMIAAERRRRDDYGIGADDEDLGEEGQEIKEIPLPNRMVQKLRVDLSVWKPVKK